MQSLDKIDETVDDIIASALLVDEDDFDDETTFGPDGLEAESLDVVEMAEMIEEDVGVHIPDEDLQEVESVGEVKEYVSEHAD